MEMNTWSLESIAKHLSDQCLARNLYPAMAVDAFLQDHPQMLEKWNRDEILSAILDIMTEESCED